MTAIVEQHAAVKQHVATTLTEGERLELAQRVADGAMCQSGDPEAWFPASDRLESQQARGLCAACPVIASCLLLALQPATHAEFGVWGGRSSSQRRRLQKDTPAAAAKRRVIAIAAAAEAAATPVRIEAVA